MPVLGASFGAPNGDLDTLANILIIGTIGGIFWSTPFAIWNLYKNRKQSGDDSPPAPILLSEQISEE